MEEEGGVRTRKVRLECWRRGFERGCCCGQPAAAAEAEAEAETRHASLGTLDELDLLDAGGEA